MDEKPPVEPPSTVGIPPEEPPRIAGNQPIEPVKESKPKYPPLDFVWECNIFNCLSLQPKKEDVPNRFHRLMQKWLLGFDWKKVKP
jgi:hypothetical protein